MLAGVRTLHHCMNDHLPTISRTAWYGRSCQFFLFKHFILIIFNYLCIVWKYFAQTCCSITIADSQTFYQRFVFNGKTYSLQTRKYDVSMTLSAAKNIYTCFLLNIPWTFCGNLNIFHEDIKQNVSGCFFWTQCIVRKHVRYAIERVVFFKYLSCDDLHRLRRGLS